jgi:hypothetical protein
VRHLRARKWSDSKIARTIQADGEFVRRVGNGLQNFSKRDVKLLSRAIRLTPMRLLFEAMGQTKLSAEQTGLFLATRELLDATEPTTGAVYARTTKRRRTRTKAA